MAEGKRMSASGSWKATSQASFIPSKRVVGFWVEDEDKHVDDDLDALIVGSPPKHNSFDSWRLSNSASPEKDVGDKGESASTLSRSLSSLSDRKPDERSPVIIIAKTWPTRTNISLSFKRAKASLRTLPTNIRDINQRTS
mmetsp:Transcript_20305/g.36151  ORF Transcript_20305/g.36151 Transcript_20305/m.36151 type:complete len:140 (-) Transcript_20305:1341-1760(-)